MDDREQYILSDPPIKEQLLSLFGADEQLVIFDIGACEGEDSIRYSRLFPRSQVHAFEPFPDNLSRIRENLQRHNAQSVTVIPLALSDREGLHDFHVSSGSPDGKQHENWDYGNKSSSLLAPGKIKEVYPWLEFKNKIRVKATTLARYLEQQQLPRVDFIHMDVQGAELMVLEGAGEHLRNIKAIWLEVSKVKLYRDQATRDELQRFLEKKGFRLIHESGSGATGDQLYVNQPHAASTPAHRSLLQKIKARIFRNEDARKSWSQSGEDRIVRYLFDVLGIKHPTYLDLGAHDPFHISNTALFYMTGSRGVNVEPDPVSFERFRKFRPLDINLNVGVGTSNATMSFYRMSSPTLHTFSKEEAESMQKNSAQRIVEVIQLPVITLREILDKHCQGRFPDFLSVDIEGLDQQVLEGQLHGQGPIVICIETISYSEDGKGRKNQGLIDMIVNSGYLLYADTYINSVFVRKDKWIQL